MKKQETDKLYNHIFYALLWQKSIIDVGYEAKSLLNGVSMLHLSGILSEKDFTNMNAFIIGLAEDRIKELSYERLNKDNEKV